MARGGDAGRGARAAEPLRGARRRRRAPRRRPGGGLDLTAPPRPDGAPAGGRFVSIEGLDFSGKSTLVRHLKSLFPDASGTATYFTREPGGTATAERIREMLLDPGAEMDAWTEAYLYAASRADHVRAEILPRLRRGEDVVCERFLDSSLAYQGCGRGLGIEAVRGLNARAVGAVVPERTFYLRLEPEERERRARELGAPLDRIEAVGAGFMRRVEDGFEKLMRQEPDRIVALDGTRSPEELARTVVGEIRRLQYTRDVGAT